MHSMLSRFVCLGFTAMLCLPAMAHDNHRHSHPTTTAAHVHGQASLNIVIEDETLLAEFHSPLDNLLGFEHAPESETEKLAYQALHDALQDYQTLFRVTDGVCEQNRHRVTEPFNKQQDNAAGSIHSEMHSEYFLHCQQATEITGIITNVFSAYPRLDKLKVQVVHSQGQSSFHLSPETYSATWQ